MKQIRLCYCSGNVNRQKNVPNISRYIFWYLCTTIHIASIHGENIQCSCLLETIAESKMGLRIQSAYIANDTSGPILSLHKSIQITKLHCTKINVMIANAVKTSALTVRGYLIGTSLE